MITGAIGVDVTYTMRSRGSRNSSRRNRKRSSYACVNVPLESLPDWMSSVSPWLPLTHGIAAARTLADGATFSSVSGALGKEAGIGALYVLIGMAMLSYFEWESRRRATLEVF